MYQKLLKEWIKTIPNKENRRYLRDRQELSVFAEWLDNRAIEQKEKIQVHAADCAINVGMLGECDCGKD